MVWNLKARVLFSAGFSLHDDQVSVTNFMSFHVSDPFLYTSQTINVHCILLQEKKKSKGSGRGSGPALQARTIAVPPRSITGC